MKINLVDKVREVGSVVRYNVEHNARKYIGRGVFVVVATAVVAGSSLSCTPKDYVSNPNMKEYTTQIVTALKDTQKDIGNQITENTATTKKYVDDQIAETKKYVDGRIEATEKARSLEETAQNLATNKEIDARIEKSYKAINDYVVGEIKTITGKLSGLEQAVNTAAGANATNKEEISKYAKQIGELKDQLNDLDKTTKTIAGATATNKADYTQQIENLKTRVTYLDQRLNQFLPPVPPGFYTPPIWPTAPYSARNVNDILTAGRYYFDADLARAMRLWDNWRFQSVFPFAQSEWFDGWPGNGEVVGYGAAVHVDRIAGQARIYLSDGRIPTSTIQAQTIVNFMLSFFSLHPSRVNEVTIQTP